MKTFWFPALVFALAVLVLLPSMKSVRAGQQVWGDMLYQFQCLPELDVMELRGLGTLGGQVQGMPMHRRKHVQSLHGIFSPRWYYSDSVERGFEREPAYFTCALSTGLVELIVLPEPLVEFSLLGGDWWRPTDNGTQSIAVTLRIAGRVILDDVPFYRCEDDAEISRLFYSAKGNGFSIKGRFGSLPGQQRTPPYDVKLSKETVVGFTIGRSDIVVQESAEPPTLAWIVRDGPLTAEDVYNSLLTTDPDPDRDGYACQYLGVDGLTPHRPPPAARPNASVDRRSPG
ncbi:MAG: hypothetical protein AB7P52_13465 [Alphaproteobacteria bacterium]